ncbi:hypothetical protein [Fibrella forsythiae]|uniref:Uncharacterized protein n=1 Tax=Fibrella forsythiae TaxID=2817061 RepID=A0ABS3JD07_9BACT|nr:hypothetical protein [Fibrella forsythiae]MBO0947876.1 hypothetical protein [Fibrella forsythiae]
MDLSKIASLITPLVLMAMMGVIMILYGFVDMKRDNNILQFLFGIPLAAGALGLHYVVRRAARNNTLHVWIAESILVGLMWYGFLHS